jgi:hypothetical protein
MESVVFPEMKLKVLPEMEIQVFLVVETYMAKVELVFEEVV